LALVAEEVEQMVVAAELLAFHVVEDLVQVGEIAIQIFPVGVRTSDQPSTIRRLRAQRQLEAIGIHGRQQMDVGHVE